MALIILITTSDGSNTIISNISFQAWNELERVHLLVIELKHLYFGYERKDMNIEPKKPSLYLQNYPSNRLEHHICEHRTDSNMFIFW